MKAEREWLAGEVYSRRVNVVSIKLIPQGKRDELGATCCDFCIRGTALYNLVFGGLFDGIQVLKRCCPECAKSFT